MKSLTNNVTAKPVVKWAGGKFKLSKTIIEESENTIDFNSYRTYIEPFVGGGGMFFSVISQYDFDEKIISDINPQLINMYRQIKSSPRELIENLETIEQDFNQHENDEKKKEFYYDLRNAFNQGITENEFNVKQASNFIALNKLGFNGLYRVNRKGLFNVPFGQKKKANIYSESNIIAVSEVLQDTEILLMDYKDTVKYSTDKSLFYIDSPYRPLPNTASFTSYSKSEFNDNSQKELAEFCKTLYSNGSDFVLSNSDPKQTDETDDFFDDLYSNFLVKRITARRAIGATAARRGLVSEILVLGTH